MRHVPRVSRAPPALALLVLFLPALSGCTWFGPVGPPPGDPVSPDLVRQAFVAPALQVTIDSPYANVRLGGRALVVPVLHDGAQAAAVYLGLTIAWRTDAVVAVRERTNHTGDVYVQPPLGEWEAQKARQAWVPASASDLSAAGFADEQALYVRASRVLPPNQSAPAPGFWFLNGTVVAKFQPGNVSLATVDGPPFVFQRNATGFLAVENRTVVNWDERNRTLVAQNDGLVQVNSQDPELGSVTFSWSAARVDVRLRTPPFKVTDLVVENDATLKAITVTLAGVGKASMISYDASDVRDNRVELRTDNMTVLMGP